MQLLGCHVCKHGNIIIFCCIWNLVNIARDFGTTSHTIKLHSKSLNAVSDIQDIILHVVIYPILGQVVSSRTGDLREICFERLLACFGERHRNDVSREEEVAAETERRLGGSAGPQVCHRSVHRGMQAAAQQVFRNPTEVDECAHRQSAV